MGGYGYSYQSYSRYSSGGLGRSDETPGPLLRKPFVPFVFGRNSDTHLAPNTNRSSEAGGYATRKKIVPVASPPYDYGHEYEHSSPPPNQVYPARNDEGWLRQPSPPHGPPQIVHDFFNKIQIEASKPSKFVPAYGGANGYGDSGNSNNKPTGNTVRNDKYDDYNGAREYRDSGKHGNQDNGYGGDYGNKEGYKPTVKTMGNDKYNDYNGARGYSDSGKYSNRDSGYGGGDYGKKEGYKPTVSSIPIDARNYGDSGKYGNQDTGFQKEGYKPTVSSIPIVARGDGDPGKYGNQDKGYGGGDYGRKEGHKPTVSSIPMDARGYGDSGKYGNQDSGNGGDYGKKEGYMPTVSSIPIDARGYGDYGKYSNTEGHKPTGNTTRYDNLPAGNYNAVEPNKATTGGGWTRSGNEAHLTEATKDIGKAMELLKEAGNAKSTRSEPEPTNKIGQTLELEAAESVKNIGIPSQSKVAVAIEVPTPSKDNYRENSDSSGREATGRNGNRNFTTGQRTSPPPSTIVDYRENVNKTSGVPTRFRKLNLGPTINSIEAEKFYNGTRI